MSEVTKEFLIKAGLPENCSPFLTFNQQIYYEGIKNIKEEYDLENDDFVNYYVIGGGDGVSVCVDTEREDQVVQIDIDHVYTVDMNEDTDYHEEYIPIRFMNTSIAHLAHCLVAYQNWMEGRSSAPDVQPTESALHTLATNLLRTDPDCLAEKSYWWFELEALKHPC